MNLEHIVKGATDGRPEEKLTLMPSCQVAKLLFSATEQRLDELINHLEHCYSKEHKIYHLLGRNGLVVLNPGVLGADDARPQDLNVL